MMSCKIANNADANFEPSRQYVYYKERLMESNGAPVSDTGANVEDGEYWAKTDGICSETSWPYVASTVNTAPPASCDVEAAKHKIKDYSALTVDSNLITNLEQLLSQNTPFCIAINVYQSFENTTNGVIPLPPAGDTCLGGHEIIVVGYTKNVQLFTVANSWGPSWGADGFCYIPYAYLANPNLTMQFTTITV
jgi:C1A family cysteine protease